MLCATESMQQAATQWVAGAIEGDGSVRRSLRLTQRASEREGERDRGTEGERDREREREKQRARESETETETERGTEGQTETERGTEGQTETEGQRDGQRARESQRETEGQRERERERQRQRDRDREKETENICQKHRCSLCTMDSLFAHFLQQLVQLSRHVAHGQPDIFHHHLYSHCGCGLSTEAETPDS